MKIHSVSGRHIIEKSGKRPFKVMIGDRIRAFSSLEAAAKAAQANLKAHQEMAVIVENAWKA